LTLTLSANNYSTQAQLANEQLAVAILHQLVDFESTSEKPQQTRLAAEAMAQRLLDAGIPPEDVLVINPMPDRDLILMLSGDKETSGDVAKWLATEGRELIDAEYAINTDAGLGQYSVDFKPRAFLVQTSEKVYQTYKLTITNPGGHSSLPRPDNSIYQLAKALVAISDYAFPVILSPDAKQMFERGSRLETGQVATDMLAISKNGQDSEAAGRLSQDVYMNALMRTTCVATMIKGGEAENALPRDVSATINCRILPGTSPAEVKATLQRLVANEAIEFTSSYDALPSPPSVLPGELRESLEALVEATWPGVPVIPEISTGATDGMFMRNAGIPVFGIAGWFMRAEDIRFHGLDEKIAINDFKQGTEFWYEMLKTLSQP